MYGTIGLSIFPGEGLLLGEPGALSDPPRRVIVLRYLCQSIPHSGMAKPASGVRSRSSCAGRWSSTRRAQSHARDAELTASH
jgi:hypothetical protein